MYTLCAAFKNEENMSHEGTRDLNYDDYDIYHATYYVNKTRGG